MRWLLEMKLKHILTILIILLAFGCTWIYLMIYRISYGVLQDSTFEYKENDIDDISHYSELYEHKENDEHREIENSQPQVEEIVIDEFYTDEYYGGNEDSFVLLDDGNYHNFETDRIINPINNALQHAESHKLPIIIWWSPFSTDNGKLKRCWSGDCYFSINQSLYSHSLTKAFLFYGTDFNVTDLPLPRKWYYSIFHSQM